MRAWRRSPPLAGVSLALPVGSTPVLPEECACCAAPSTHSVSTRVAGGAQRVLVRYCDDCAEHQAGSSARVLALALASLLLALSAAAGLPLLWPRLGLFGLIVSSVVLACLPLLALLLPARPIEAPHTARGPAVMGEGGDRWLFTAPRFGELVASLNGTIAQPASIRERSASAWLFAGPVLGVGAACLSFFVYHPLLRVLNLGTARIEVALDGAPLAGVDPTSNESPAAGALLRVPAGEHTLSISASADGSPLGSLRTELHSGAVHLVTFAAEQQCFWLETSGYGREERVEPSYQFLPPTAESNASAPRSEPSADSVAATETVPMSGSVSFWILPGGIDTWFAPNPESSDPGARSSGGVLTALRQAPCAQAPQEVRPAQ